MKILRIDLQTNDVSVYDNKEQLRRGLIDLHMDDIVADEETDETYIEKYKCLEYITSSGYNITDFKYQITKPSQGYHTWHCEYDASIPKTNLRWGVWTFYLNDVEEGGETEFLYQSYRLKPKTGTFSIFPAYYTHTHRGNPPISNTKHIITGWIEYPPEFVNKNEKNDSKRNT